MISTEVGGDNGSLADELRTNEPPDLTVEGAKTRTVKVGQPLTLAAIAGDPDNLPARRDGKPQPGVKKATSTVSRRPRPTAAPDSAAVVYRPPVVGGRLGRTRACTCRGSCIAARPPAVTLLARSDEDVDGHARLRQLDVVAAVHRFPSRRPTAAGPPAAVFSEPGTYVLRAVASDGALFTYDNVTVTVTP